VALADYTRHMRAVAFAAREAPTAGIALHAGELTLGLVPPRHLRFHIREAVEIAGAQRIGHGVDVMFEDEPYALLDTLRERNVLVEVNLTSNEVILGVAGDDHPLPAYMAAGVPVTLSTDDEGVSRIDLTHEYQRAVQTYELDYADVKAFSMNGIDHAFLPAAERVALRAELEARFRAFEASVKPSGELR
jgi:adenosine deaminase